MANSEEWEKILFQRIDGGYDVSKPPYDIETDRSPHIENMIMTRGFIETDYGISTFGSSVRGYPQLLYQFDYKDGTTELLLFTTLTMYKWNQGEWQYPSNGTSTQVDNVGGYAASTTAITVDDDTGFSDGDHVGIILSDGTQHTDTVNGAPAANVITITDGLSGACDNNATVVKAPLFTGRIDYPPTADTFPASDIVIFTNGTDNVKMYDGTSCEDVTNLVAGVGGGNCYARLVVVKDNKVLLLNTNENGTDYPQRVRWCAVGDYTDWTTANDAGYEDLYDVSEKIVAADELGPYLIVYKEESIIRCSYVNSGSLIYYFEEMVRLDSATSANSVINRGTVHIVFGRNGMFAYEGGYTTIPFGNEIWDKIWGDIGELDKDSRSRVWGAYLFSIDEYWFGVPTSESDFPTIIWRFDVKGGKWTRRNFTYPILCAMELEVLESTTWANASGAWSANAWNIPWNDPSLTTGEARVLLGGITGGSTYQCFQYLDTATDDNGTDITFEYQTPEILPPSGYVRVNRMIFDAKGNSVSVYYSTDQGISWSLYGTESPSSGWGRSIIWKQLAAKRLMFKFTGTGAYAMSHLEIEYQFDADW